MPTAKSSSKSSKTEATHLRDSSDPIVIGKVVRAHGVRGHLLVAVDATVAGVIAPGSDLFLLRGRARRPSRVSSVRAHPHGLVVGFEGVADRNAAEELRGMNVAVERSSLPTPRGGEYYDFELIGLEVAGTDGSSFGRVVEVLETGANDVCVAREGRREVLVPMTSRAVVEIDRRRGRIVVEPDALLAEESPATPRGKR